MARRTHELLASHAGRRASANGATQIRAGVLRPEIIIPLADETAGGTGQPQAEEARGLTIGSTVRIIREPGFGRLGVVRALPPEARRVESEATVSFRVLSLESLVRMKLTSFRDKDRVHLRDLMDVGLVDAGWLERIPAALRARLQALLDNPEG